MLMMFSHSFGIKAWHSSRRLHSSIHLHPSSLGLFILKNATSRIRISHTHFPSPLITIEKSFGTMTTPSELPKVPAQHADFISYVQSNPNTPLPGLLEPYKRYDAKLREVFAQ